MREKKITIDARMINSSGIGTYLKNILPLIVDKFDLTLLGDVNALNKFDWSKDCKLIEFNFGIYSIMQHLHYLRIPKSDVLWCPHINTPIFKTRVKKIITTIHDVNHLAYNNKKGSLKSLYAKLMYDNSVKNSFRIITVSDFSRSEIIKHTKVQKEKVTVIHCGINEVFFKNKKLKYKNELPEKYFLFVGNVKPHKNLITLLEAYNSMSEELKLKYKLVILGKREGFITSDSKSIEFIRNHKLEENVYFTGYIHDDEVPFIYSNAELLVFPSFYEGFGLPLLEAMASGIPIVSSDTASLPEIAGDAAIYFNPKSSLDLKKIIETLLKNEEDKRKLIEKGYQRVKMFSWGKAALEHVKVFSSC